jgi:hypothetical protein
MAFNDGVSHTPPTPQQMDDMIKAMEKQLPTVPNPSPTTK